MGLALMKRICFKEDSFVLLNALRDSERGERGGKQCADAKHSAPGLGVGQAALEPGAGILRGLIGGLPDHGGSGALGDSWPGGSQVGWQLRGMGGGVEGWRGGRISLPGTQPILVGLADHSEARYEGGGFGTDLLHWHLFGLREPRVPPLGFSPRRARRARLRSLRLSFFFVCVSSVGSSWFILFLLLLLHPFLQIGSLGSDGGMARNMGMCTKTSCQDPRSTTRL